MKKIVFPLAMATVLVFGAIVLAEMPGPNPDALWRYIKTESPYTEWKFWPDHQGMQPGRAPMALCTRFM